MYKLAALAVIIGGLYVSQAQSTTKVEIGKANQDVPQVSSGSSQDDSKILVDEDATRRAREDEQIMRKITRYYEARTSPFSDPGRVIVTIARSYGVDPIMFASVGIIESGGCVHIPQGSFNCWGWGNGSISFDSFSDGVDQVVRSIGTRKIYGRYQQSGRVEDFAQVYNPAGGEGYIKKIKAVMQQIEDTSL